MKPIIMVVDDEKMIRDVFQDALTQEGYQVFTACNGVEATLMVKQNKPDLALLDLNMPEMGGIETFQHLKEIKNDMAVIILTGCGTLNTAKEAMKLGAYDYLTKPFNLGLVKKIIRSALDSAKGDRSDSADES